MYLSDKTGALIADNLYKYPSWFTPILDGDYDGCSWRRCSLPSWSSTASHGIIEQPLKSQRREIIFCPCRLIVDVLSGLAHCSIQGMTVWAQIQGYIYMTWHCSGGHLHAHVPVPHTTGDGKRAQYTLANGLCDDIIVTIIHLLQFYILKRDCIYDCNTINKFLLFWLQPNNEKIYSGEQGKYDYFSCMELWNKALPQRHVQEFFMCLDMLVYV